MSRLGKLAVAVLLLICALELALIEFLWWRQPRIIDDRLLSIKGEVLGIKETFVAQCTVDGMAAQSSMLAARAAMIETLKCAEMAAELEKIKRDLTEVVGKMAGVGALEGQIDEAREEIVSRVKDGLLRLPDDKKWYSDVLGRMVTLSDCSESDPGCKQGWISLGGAAAGLQATSTEIAQIVSGTDPRSSGQADGVLWAKLGLSERAVKDAMESFRRAVDSAIVKGDGVRNYIRSYLAEVAIPSAKAALFPNGLVITVAKDSELRCEDFDASVTMYDIHEDLKALTVIPTSFADDDGQAAEVGKEQVSEYLARFWYRAPFEGVTGSSVCKATVVLSTDDARAIAGIVQADASRRVVAAQMSYRPLEDRFHSTLELTQQVRDLVQSAGPK